MRRADGELPGPGVQEAPLELRSAATSSLSSQLWEEVNGLKWTRKDASDPAHFPAQISAISQLGLRAEET